MDLSLLWQLPKEKKILILGLGQENMQFLKWLVEVVHFPLEQILLADKNTPTNSPLFPPAENMFFGEDYLSALKKPDLEYVFKTPGICSLLPPLEKFRQDKGQDKIHSSLVFFFHKFREQIVAISGTKGKSTTSSLVNHFLNHSDSNPEIKAFYCGNTTNISPYTFWTQVDQMVDSQTYFVVETSSFQLQDLGFAKISPKYGVITNYYTDHLDQHSDVNEYWASKDNLFKFQVQGDVLVTGEQILSVRPKLLTSPGQGQKLVVDYTNAEQISMLLSSHLLGEHNEFNLALAVIITQVIQQKLTFSSVDEVLKTLEDRKLFLQKALQSFTPLKHRLELVRSIHSTLEYNQKSTPLVVNFYDDGYATEPDAVIAAIRALTTKPNQFLWLELTGKDKGADPQTLARQILQTEFNGQLYRVDYAGQVGRNILRQIYTELAADLEPDLELFKPIIEVEFADFSQMHKDIQKYFTDRWQNFEQLNLIEKVQLEMAFVEISLNVVLSPAGSSFDEFENATLRSDWWVDKVKHMKAN